MKYISKWLNRVFIDGLSGMAQGLFATLIVGTIIQQIGTLVGGEAGTLIFTIGKVAASLTGAGIGVGVASKYKESPLVILSAATAGMVGAFAGSVASGKVLVDGVMSFSGPGEPLGAFIAAYIGIEAGHLVSGRTKVDILVTPLVSISAGSAVGILIGPSISQMMTSLGAMINWGTEQQPFLMGVIVSVLLVSISAGSAVGILIGPSISQMMTSLGAMINWGTEQQPFLMGVIVSVLMGMILTLPISSAAIGVVLNLSGLAAGAATVGCCCNMVGFAVASYRENKVGGLLAQGVGTSMLQVPNIVRKPIIWLPAILSSAILGPVGTMILKMTNNATGSGMGTAGFVGQIMASGDFVKCNSRPGRYDDFKDDE